MDSTTPAADPANWFSTLDGVLRGRYLDPEQLSGRSPLPVGRLLLLALGLAALYGLCIGTYGLLRGADYALAQLVAGAIKLPAVYGLTVAVTLPSLYVFAALRDLPIDFRGLLSLILLMVCVQVTVTASLGPVFSFFAASTTSYPFLVLLHVAICGVGGLLGFTVLRGYLREAGVPAVATAMTEAPSGSAQRADAGVDVEQPAAHPTPTVTAPDNTGNTDDSPTTPTTQARSADVPPPPPRPGHHETNRLVVIWCIVYAFVGAQTGWLLRPFLGRPGTEFGFLRAPEDNFFIAVLERLGELFAQ